MILTLPQALESLAQKDAQIEELLRKLESTQRQLTTLQHQMEQMIRRLYGQKSEKIDPNQMMFDSIVLSSLKAPQPPVAELPAKPEAAKPRKPSQHHGRVPIPEHLERVEILPDIPEEQKVCPETGEPLKVITVEVSEKLEYRPGKLIVNVYKRPQYALPEKADSLGGVIAAPMPDHPVAKCKADVGLIAHLIVSKFADHLPLYRQDGIFERDGVTITRGTQSSWLMQTYESLRVLEEVCRRAIQKEGIIEVGCWAHARRKFDEAVSSRPAEATDILARIARLYHEVEPPCAGMEPEQRRRFRQEHAAPILKGIFEKFEELRLQTIPSEPLRKAIDYTLNLRQALCRYLEDGRLRPDNNLAENAMRPMALGRKNWLFVDSERGGRAAALFMGLVESCKARQINPWEYFDDMLRRSMSHPVTRLRELLPDRWEPLPKDERGMILAARA